MQQINNFSFCTLPALKINQPNKTTYLLNPCDIYAVETNDGLNSVQIKTTHGDYSMSVKNPENDIKSIVDKIKKTQRNSQKTDSSYIDLSV